MKTAQQIIKDTYDTNPKLKTQLDYYGLTIDDVGVTFIQSMEYFNNNAPITLGYDLKSDKVVSCSILFIHSKIENMMREKKD